MKVIQGDITKALGISTYKLNDNIELDFSSSTAEDIVKFQELPAKALAGKKQDDLTFDDGIRLKATYRNYFISYFMDKDPSLQKDHVSKFVVTNFEELQKAFTVGFGIKSEAEYDKDMSEAREKQKN